MDDPYESSLSNDIMAIHDIKRAADVGHAARFTVVPLFEYTAELHAAC